MLEISVILPTRNRSHLLPFVLDALKQQTLPPSQFEIIAVDDGSTDNTQEVLNRWRADLPLRVFRQRHAGLGAAKNLGIFASRGPILLFLDDDDVAATDLLSVHVAAHKVHYEQEVAVLGYTGLSAEVARSPLMRHVTQVGCQLFSYGWMKAGVTLDYTAFWGGRSSCKRALLIQRGIFNPLFTFGYEDIELGWRLARFGFRVIYEPAAVSTMIRTLTFRDFCVRQQRQGRSQQMFAQLHMSPEIRKYCEIDIGFDLWARNAGQFSQYTRWVERLDHMATIRAKADLPLDPLAQAALDDAYRATFMLCRAKGLASDVSAVASAQTTGDGYDTNSPDAFGPGQPAYPAPLQFEQSTSIVTDIAATLDSWRPAQRAQKEPEEGNIATSRAIAGLSSPKATIVVCTYNRYQYLRGLLPRLERQNADFIYEILIVDNSDDEASKAGFYGTTQLPYSARVVPSFPPGLSRARNVGLQAAKGKYILFVDDDTEPGADWLSEIVKVFDECNDAAVVGGPIYPIWPVARPVWIPPKYEDCLTTLDMGEERKRIEYGYVYGANISFRTETLRAIGGFLEHLGRQGGVALLSNEELQVQDELRKQGYSVYYAPKAGLSHHVHQGRISRGWFRRRMSWQAVSDALTMGGLSDINQGLDFLISAADRAGIDRSFLNCLVDTEDADKIQAQLEFLRSLTTLALSSNANLSADKLAQLIPAAKTLQPEPTGAVAISRGGAQVMQASKLARGGPVFFEATPGHEFLFDTFSALKDPMFLTRQLDPWAEDEEGIGKLFSFLERGLQTASERSSPIVFLTLDYWERPYLPIGEVVSKGFKQRVLDSRVPAFAFLHRYFTDPGGIARLQRIAPALRKVIVFSPDMKQDLETKIGLTNVEYVALPGMIENLPAADRPAVRARLSIAKDRVVVSLLGEARKGKSCEFILQALALLSPQTKRKAFFLFGGKASAELLKAVQGCLNEHDLMGLVDLRIVSDRRTYIALTDAEFGDYLRVSDVGLLIYREDQRFGMSAVLPNYVIAGKPVIATADSYPGKLVARHGLGSVLVEETPAELARLIDEAVASAPRAPYEKALAKYRPEIEKKLILTRLNEIFAS